MSKIIVSISIKNLQNEVLKELLDFCDYKSLQRKNSINEPLEEVKVEFLYDYIEELTKEQSEAIVFYASKEDVENQINERKNEYLNAN